MAYLAIASRWRPTQLNNERIRDAVANSNGQVVQLRRTWTTDEQDVVLLFCAKLIATKRLDLLLHAVAKLNNPHVVLAVVGSGPLESQLKSLAQQLNVRVCWCGFVNQAEIPYYYAAADVQVLPSSFEQWGLVVNEGLACNCPCIVSDVVGAGPDLIANSGAGLIFRSGDIDSLAQALSSALDKATREFWRSRCDLALKCATYDNFAAALRRLQQRGLLAST